MLGRRVCGAVAQVAVAWGLWLGPVAVMAQTVPPDAVLLPDAKFENAEAARLGRQLYLSPRGLGTADAEGAGQASLPRLAASLTGMHWLGHEAAAGLSLKVEPEQWIVSWKERPAEARVIVLSFDDPPKLMGERKPLQAAGDGSIYLPAHQAVTVGEKIRYEPQTFKNTVGYWVGKSDYAQWQLQIRQPGRYNVAILQGCGAGQGGSRALLSITAVEDSQPASAEAAAAAQLEFEVLETGHFQNFQWRHLGNVELAAGGLFQLRLAPIEIKKNALMDVRAVHLIPVP